MNDAPAAHRAARIRQSIAVVGAMAFLGLFIDALARPRTGFDYDAMQLIRDIEFPGLEPVLRFASDLTASVPAISVWALSVVIALALRRWLVAVCFLAFPVVGAVNGVVQLVVGRARPDGAALSADFFEPLENDFASFPSGHVVGAVLLYGLLFVLAAGIPHAAIRVPIRIACAAVILLSGLARIWLGAHWVGDVLAAWALGGLALAGVTAAYRAMAPTFGNLPLVHAAPLELRLTADREVHALTSTVLFQGDRVLKLYNPGFIPRFIYWISFQAPFAYQYNELALEAAVLRRRLAGELTEYWYGESRVGRALGVARIEGHLALVSERIEGQEPADHHRARAFLADLATRFEAAGLPTWQIDPRQPRSLGNILETADGRYVVVDLESGLVSPLASPRAWWRAIRRGLLPFYDDVYFDVTRGYLQTEEAAIRASNGDAFYNRLAVTVADAERAALAWHRGEPRFWSRVVQATWAGFGIPALPGRLQRLATANEARASEWLDSRITVWSEEGRLDEADAQRVREAVASAGVQAVLPHFGVHLAIGVALRFPFGSIARVSYTTANLLASCALLIARKRTSREFRQSFGIHSPLVIMGAALPGFGTFAYLLAWPMLRNFLLIRIAVDGVGEKVPFHLYRRLGFRRIVAKPSRYQSHEERPAA